MSDNQQQPSAPRAGNTIGDAINAWSDEVLKTFAVTNELGQTGIAVPPMVLLQGYMDMRLTQLKLEALFEELDREHLVDSKKCMERLFAKLEHERKAAKQSNDARPKVTAVQGSVAGAINGKKFVG